MTRPERHDDEEIGDLPVLLVVRGGQWRAR
jgi:hypothetical protein